MKLTDEQKIEALKAKLLARSNALAERAALKRKLREDQAAAKLAAKQKRANLIAESKALTALLREKNYEDAAMVHVDIGKMLANLTLEIAAVKAGEQ